MILVGNKCDNKNMKKSLHEKAHQLSQNVLKCPFIQTSAKDGANVKDCFHKIFELISEQVEEAAKRDELETNSIKRRNSSMSFARRISVNVNFNKPAYSRRHSEPVGGSNNELDSKLDSTLEINQRKHRNCLIS